MKCAPPLIALCLARVPFPEGGAAARRIWAMPRHGCGLGYEVVIVSGTPPDAQGQRFDVAPGSMALSTKQRDGQTFA